jgi:transcription elongation factor Elf1
VPLELGRRRRRVVRIVKKKLPTVFTCPRCGEEAVRVTIDKQTGNATVLCALCQLKDEFPAHPAAQAIDVYSYFTDRFYGVKDPRAIIPREREHLTAPSEPEEPSLETSGEESTAIEVVPETPLAETLTNPVPDAPRTQPVEAEPSPTDSMNETNLASEDSSAEESTLSQEADEKAESDEEGEPFADILQENKDKKRYSPNPLPPQASEET